MQMGNLVERAIRLVDWENEQADDSLDENKEMERLAYQGQVIVTVALMSHLGRLVGYVQRNVVGMGHNFGICEQTITVFVIKMKFM
jgi:hypothetical protein